MFFSSNDETTIGKFLKKEEKHHANAINFYELFLMCKDRYILIENELFDLKKLLKHHFEINSLVFKENVDGDIALVINFNDEKKEFIVITLDSFGDVNIVLDTTGGKYNKLINYAKTIIIDAFEREDRLSISKAFDITSSSDAFHIKGLSNELGLVFNNKNLDHMFKLNYLFDMDKINSDNMLKYFECKTDLYSIKDKIKNLETLKMFLSNIKIEEDSVPKLLLKK